MRMGVDHRLAAIELVEHRGEDLVAEPVILVAGDEMHAVAFEDIESVFDLFQRTVDIGQRQAGKMPEAAGIISHQSRHIVVVLARIGAARLALCLLGQGRGIDGERDAGLVHVLECVFLVHDRSEMRGEYAPFAELRNVLRGDEMMMNVDTGHSERSPRRSAAEAARWCDIRSR
jgi:hypothetical protein